VSRLIPPLVALALVAGACPAARAQDLGATVQVTLVNGDVLTGVLVARTSERIVIDHALLGRVFLDPAAIRTAPPPAEPPAPVVAPLAAPAVPPPAPEDEASAWDGTVDLGADVSTGNTDTADFRLGVDARREDEETQTDLSFVYRYRTEDGEATEDERALSGRYQWLEPDSAWRTFVEASWERDRFKDFDARVRLGGGRAYAFHDTDETQMIGRTGLGVTKEIGAPDEDLMLQGILGFDYEHQLAERQRFVSGVTLYPTLDDLGEYQAQGRALWELRVSETDPWALRLGVETKYDSDPGDAGTTDVNYFASLGYRF